ncbi:MAG: 9-O-acetylesterase, partial [Planctomycetes bacterium]|nr:9-O-acetylesterase [Planctomycetota bacterium]
ALANNYDQDIVYSGPIFKSMKIKNDKALLRFDHVGSGLVTKDDRPLKGFAVAGADKKFFWADAKIVDNKVIVKSDKVKAPVAVRYGWAHNPVCNFYNKEGLPASPFRTDDWPGLTYKKK